MISIIFVICRTDFITITIKAKLNYKATFSIPKPRAHPMEHEIGYYSSQVLVLFITSYYNNSHPTLTFPHAATTICGMEVFDLKTQTESDLEKFPIMKSTWTRYYWSALNFKDVQPDLNISSAPFLIFGLCFHYFKSCRPYIGAFMSNPKYFGEVESGLIREHVVCLQTASL